MRIVLIFVFIFIAQIVESQNQCECCAYQSINYSDNMIDFFNPQTIVKRNYKAAIIYTVEHIGTKENRYIQAKIQFDNNGRVLTKKIFNSGIASTIIDYKRDINGLIIVKTECYMDSLENKSNFMSPKIEDYEYDKNQNLKKFKKRDNNGKVISDNLTEYTKYEYDKLNRVVREYRYTYYDAKNISIFDQKIDYLTNTDSKSITQNNGVSWMQTISKYNSKFRLISQIDYNLSNSKMLWEKHYSYNDNNQMTSMIQKNGSAVSECPENDNYSEEYIYNSKNLVDKILHKFGNVTCEMQIEYK